MMTLPWSAGRWLNPPAAVEDRGGDLLVTAVEEFDAWRRVSYGFIADTAHALLAPLEQNTAVEVDMVAAFTADFDQPAIMVRIDAENWSKAGIGALRVCGCGAGAGVGGWRWPVCSLGGVVRAPVVVLHT
ncbi:DUF1349 domain-containing protein [Actinomyces ruminis]|uniref:DUF1349 domain-containing protein n=1 Tax=Actinomyces ruminis TaxID=1937003 RepID=A0ABX4MAP1_9ACTO|nr:DUF1349 domain-containing protein [Actinomyces ruminis]PHP52491.1 DUF1349 domain-containing protein [Actinomyces ruminis]